MDVVLAFLLALPAQVAPTWDVGTIVQTAGGVSAFGLVAWLLKRVFTHTIPRLAKDFKQALDAQAAVLTEELRNQRSLHEREYSQQREDFRAELQQQRNDFKDEMAREREFFAQQLQRLSTAVEHLERTLRERCPFGATLPPAA